MATLILPNDAVLACPASMQMVVKLLKMKTNRVRNMANEVNNCFRAAQLVPSGIGELVGFTENLNGCKGLCAIVFIDGG